MSGDIGRVIHTSLAEGTGCLMQSSQHLQMSASSTCPGWALAPRRWMARRRSWQYISSKNDRNAINRGRPPPIIAPNSWKKLTITLVFFYFYKTFISSYLLFCLLLALYLMILHWRVLHLNKMKILAYKKNWRLTSFAGGDKICSILRLRTYGHQSFAKFQLRLHSHLFPFEEQDPLSFCVIKTLIWKGRELVYRNFWKWYVQAYPDMECGRTLSLSWYHCWHVLSSDSRKVSVCSRSTTAMQRRAAGSAYRGDSTARETRCPTASIRVRAHTAFGSEN